MLRLRRASCIRFDTVIESGGDKSKIKVILQAKIMVSSNTSTYLRDLKDETQHV